MQTGDVLVKVLMASGNNIVLDEEEGTKLQRTYESDAGYSYQSEGQYFYQKVTDIHGNEITVALRYIQAIKITTGQSRQHEKRYYVSENTKNK